jgi:anti-anti-sigma factor
LEAFDHFVVRETRPGVLKLAGELDVVGVPEVQRHLGSVTGDVTLDCADLTFIDGAGLGMFVQLYQRCEARGVKLLFVEPPECMTMLFELTGLDELFTVQPSGALS